MIEETAIQEETTVSSEEALQASAAEEAQEWIHDRIEDPSYFGGYKILPSCVCPACGYHANKEKTVCPRCGKTFIL